MPPHTATIVEVGPRDGLQSEPEQLATEVKVEFVRRLLDTGIRRLEVTSFVHPKRVPQMADAEAVMAALPRRPGVSLIGLVLNERGFERAVAAGVDEVGFVIVASDTFNRRNQGVDSRDSLAVWRRIRRLADDAGLAANVMISAAWGCPFEGEVDPRRVLDLAGAALQEGPIEIGLADTIGAGTPWEVESLVRKLVAASGGTPVRCHFHNTRNSGIANAYAALEAGAARLDASTGGIGGCPFAPAATGNIATEDLLYMMNRAGIETGVSLGGVLEVAHWLSSQLGRPVPSMLSRAGNFPNNEAA